MQHVVTTSRRCYHRASKIPYRLDRPSDSPFRRSKEPDKTSSLPSETPKKEPPPPPAIEPTIGWFKALFRPTLVATTVTLGSFGLAAIWEYEKEARRKSSKEQSIEEPFGSPNFDSMSEKDTLETSLPQQQQQSTPSPLRFFTPVIPEDYKEWWEGILQDPRAHTVGPLIVADFGMGTLIGLCETLVLGRVKGQEFFRYTGAGRGIPVLVAPFGHGGLLHLTVASVFLWKYGDPLVQKLGNKKETFWAAFVSAGSLAAVGGIVLDRLRHQFLPPPRIVFPKLKAPMVALGAPYAVLYAHYFSSPDTQSRVRYFNVLGREFRFPVADAILGLVVVDCFGLALGHRVFGNGSHLSGAAIGYYAVKMGGIEQVKAYQRYVVQLYTNLKGRG